MPFSCFRKEKRAIFVVIFKIQSKYQMVKKKIILPFMLWLQVAFVSAQIYTEQVHLKVENPTGLDEIFIFPTVTNATEIRYKGTYNTIKWSKFENGTSVEISNATYLSPENNKGYICEVDGVVVSHFWVFDYQNYSPQFTSLVVSDSDFPCETVKLSYTGNLPLFRYQNPQGGTLDLIRKFEVKNKTLVWRENTWTEEDTTTMVVLSNHSFKVPTPLINSVFTLSGDQFAKDLGMVPVSITSEEYESSAVNGKLVHVATTRDALNENNRPKNETILEASAPLDMQFKSNPTPKVKSFLWQIYLNGELLLNRATEDHIYTFDKAGNYKVKLTVSNLSCAESDSIAVVITESQIMVPKIFTPNGDGVNDEFRVAYQSLNSFDGMVKNRWGRTVFQWTNPEKGWDGTVNGREATEGTYFYLINAVGADGKKYQLKGHINLLR